MKVPLLLKNVFCEYKLPLKFKNIIKIFNINKIPYCYLRKKKKKSVKLT